jgi:hypothetical protein
MGLLVQNAQDRHFQQWPILGRSGPAPDFGPVATTYYGELDSLKNWITIRLEWLDANMPGLCVPTGLAENTISDNLICYPNPAQDNLTVDYTLSAPVNVTVRLYNSLGAEVSSSAQGKQVAGRHSLTIDTSNLAPGVYILRFEKGEEIISKKIVVTE